MTQNKIITILCQVIVWLGLAVVLFSSLYLNSHLFFPFIVTKTIAFNIAVEIMFLAFLFLAWQDSRYHLKINLTVVLFGIYIVFIFISSLLGDDFYRSFWSNNERSEGILLLLHLFLFLIVLTGFFRKFKDWLYVLDLSFLASLVVSLVALGQYLKIPWILTSSGGSRLAGTIGNAGYMAGYLVFAVFFGLFLFNRRQNIFLRLYYSVGITLALFITLFTQTRGAWLAIFFSGFIFIVYILFFYFRNKRSIIFGSIIILLAIILPVLLFVNKDSSFVKNNGTLNRIASISRNSTTAENRLMTWESSWQGFKERPLMGWGYENFYQPFDKYFNPNIYRHIGSVVWFDRAHNIIFDRLITGGILGLLAYLSLLFLPFYYFWRHFKVKEGGSKKYYLPVIFTLVMLAYFIQNLFIFEALVTYIPLFLVLGFVSLFGKQFNFEFLKNKKITGGLFIGWLVLIIPVVYLANIKPLNANINITKALSVQNLTIQERINIFDEVLAKNTYGNQEYRRQLFGLIEKIVLNVQDVKDLNINEVVERADIIMHDQIKDNPYSAANYIILMRFNNMTSAYQPERLYENINLFDSVIGLSPNRQHFYYEIGYTYLYLANNLKNIGNIEESEKNYDLAVEQFKKAIALNDKNIESYRQLISVLVSAGRDQAIIDQLDTITSKEINYDRETLLKQIVSSAQRENNYQLVKFFVNELIKLQPNNLQYHVQLAMAYAYGGEDEEAIEIAEMIAELGGEQKAQAEAFIQDIRAGKYKTP